MSTVAPTVGGANAPLPSAQPALQSNRLFNTNTWQAMASIANGTTDYSALSTNQKDLANTVLTAFGLEANDNGLNTLFTGLDQLGNADNTFTFADMAESDAVLRENLVSLQQREAPLDLTHNATVAALKEIRTALNNARGVNVADPVIYTQELDMVDTATLDLGADAKKLLGYITNVEGRANALAQQATVDKDKISTISVHDLGAVGLVPAEPEGPRVVRTQTGEASWYGPGFHGRRTASGEIYNQNELTVAHPSLPFGTEVRITRGNQSVIARVNDRGPYAHGRIVDLSAATASAIGMGANGAGTGHVTLEVLASGR
jgi:rare lipoprotein A